MEHQPTQQERLTANLKLAVSVTFQKQKDKQRITDPIKNQELLTHLGAALQVIEAELSADIVAIMKGADIYRMYPHLETDEVKKFKAENIVVSEKDWFEFKLKEYVARKMTINYDHRCNINSFFIEGDEVTVNIIHKPIPDSGEGDTPS